MTKTKTKKAVFRFVLTAQGPNVVMIAPGAIVTHVQPHKKGVELFALVDPTAEPEPKDFYVAKTGEPVEGEFVGTATLPALKALHVFAV